MVIPTDRISDGRTAFSRGWSGVQLDGVVVAPDWTVIKNTDRSPSEPISGDIQFSDIVHGPTINT